MRNTSTIYFLYTMPDGIENKNIEVKITDIVPDSLSYSYSPNFSSQNTLGRMSPIQVYTGGSNKEYSFTLSLHEDILSNTKYSSLSDLVDTIKSLSYPVVSQSGTIKIPSVYFQIGSIAGKGIINTSHSWKKPFRNGRYILVDINFSITAEEVFPKALFIAKDTEVEYEGPELIYTNIVRISSGEILPDSLTQQKYLPEGITEEFGANEDSWIFGAYDESTTNLISTVPTGPEAAAYIAYSINYYDRTEEIINLLLDNVAGSHVGNKAVTKLKDSLDLTSTDFVKSSPYRYTELDTKIKDLEKLSERFKTFLDYYYDNIDTAMTRDEYDKILSEIQVRIDQVIEMYRTVSSYAPSN